MQASLFQDPTRRPCRRQTDRIWPVTGAVVLAHLGVGWAISSGVLNPVMPMATRDTVIMASLVMDAPAPPAPSAPKSEVVPPHPKAQSKLQAQTNPQPVTPISPQPQPPPTPLVTQAAPGQTAPWVTATAPTPEAAAPAPPAAHVSAGHQRPSSLAAATTTVQIVQPSTPADYLSNPAPPYPRVSKRLGEQGTVVIRVFINAQGRAEQAEIRSTSGYARLDDSALTSVQSWRFVPGQRNGATEAMWFNVPIRFVLD